MLDAGMSVTEVAMQLGVTRKVIRRWRDRQQEGADLSDLPRVGRPKVGLQRILRNESAAIDQGRIRRLTASMRRRCLAVINAAGGHTRY